MRTVKKALLASVAAACLFFSALPAEAAVTVSPQLQTQINNGNVQGVIRNFGAVDKIGGDGATIQTYVNQLKADAAVNNTAAQKVAGGVSELSGRAGFLGKVSALGNVALYFDAFSAGWVIGTAGKQ